MNPELRPPSLSILVVDDEPIVRQSLTDWFRQDGHVVDSAEDASAALRLASRRSHDVAFVDIRMPGIDGLELQARLRADDPGLTIIIMTAYASVETAVEALKSGAYDYVTKPFDPEELSLLVRRVAEQKALQSENLRLRRRLTAVSAPSPIIGDSPAMRRVKDLIAAVSETDSTVLVKGESGTGKELVARAIHARSHRRLAPIVIVNCGALAEGVLESELFGHEKGAFTGAHQRHKGKFESADGGTIFLDEIGSISQKVQVELLRVLEEKTVTRVGGDRPIAVDFRVVAATNQDLERMVTDGGFREDLFWRLHVFTVEIPPLRERPGDVDLLARHFLERFCNAMNRRPLEFSPAALQTLETHTWPGNVRELQNAIERAIVVASSPLIEIEDLPVRVTRSSDRPAPLSLAAAEESHILAILRAEDWNISRAAKTLDIDRGTLYNKLRKYGIQRPHHGS